MVSWMMEKTRMMVRDREMIYNMVVHAVLLYGRERWVITGAMVKVLDAFHHQIVRRLIGKMDRSVGD